MDGRALVITPIPSTRAILSHQRPADSNNVSQLRAPQGGGPLWINVLTVNECPLMAESGHSLIFTLLHIWGRRMKKLDLGHTIPVFANAGVIAGIVFLGLKLQQNNCSVS